MQQKRSYIPTCDLCGERDQFQIIYKEIEGHHECSPGRDVYRSSSSDFASEQVVRCRSCGLILLNPRLDASAILKGYSQAIDSDYVSQGDARIQTFHKSVQFFSSFVKKKNSAESLPPTQPLRRTETSSPLFRERLQAQKPTALVFYASSVFNAEGLYDAIRQTKQALPGIRCLVIENTQAVTGYSLQKVLGTLQNSGADWVILGEPEEVLPSILIDLMNPELNLEELTNRYSCLWKAGASTEKLIPANVEFLGSKFL